MFAGKMLHRRPGLEKTQQLVETPFIAHGSFLKIDLREWERNRRIGRFNKVAHLFAWLRKRSESLYPAIAAHAAFNFVMGTCIFLALWPASSEL